MSARQNNYIPTHVNRYEESPQRAIDLCCAQEALRKLMSQITANRLQGGPPNRALSQQYFIAKDLCRNLSKTFAKCLTEKQRAFVHYHCKGDFVARVTARLTSEVTLAAPLPKRPPGMK